MLAGVFIALRQTENGELQMSTEQRLASLERTVRFQRATILAVIMVGGVMLLAGARGEKEEMHVNKITTEMVSIVNDKGMHVGNFGVAGNQVQLLLSADGDNGVLLKSTPQVNSAFVTYSGRRCGLEAKDGAASIRTVEPAP